MKIKQLEATESGGQKFWFSFQHFGGNGTIKRC